MHTCFLGLITGRPEEETNTYGRYLLKELTKTHERAQKAMKSMVKALWLIETPLEGMAELANHFKGARRFFEL